MTFNAYGNYSNRSISTTTTLTASDFGTLVVAGGSSAYTITLPSVTNNGGRFIDLVFNTTSNALVTLLPASGTISGQSSVVYGSNEGCRIVTDGTNWFVAHQSLQPVSFGVYLSGGQTLTTAAAQIVTFDTKNFDIGTFFNTTNHNYIPLYPGKYKFQYMLQWGAVTTQTMTAGVYLNGSVQRNTFKSLTNGYTDGTEGFAIVQLNGSTDTIDVRASINVSNNALGTGSSATYLSGFRISNF